MVPQPVSVDDGFHSRNAAISPNGQRVAYASKASGEFQVYVRPFPGPGPLYAVSVDGGDTPVWHPDGRRLFYVSGARMVVRYPAGREQARARGVVIHNWGAEIERRAREGGR